MSFIQAIRQLRPHQYLGAVFVFLLLFSLYIGALDKLIALGAESSWKNIWQDPYLWQIIKFSLWQALLSSLLSILLGALLARAFFYQNFIGKKWLLRLFSLTFVLPSLVAIFGIIGVYGSSGWLAQLCQWLALPWQPNIYGLSGILLAHLFFNIPLACRVILQALHSIPNQQHKLAAQLNISSWQFIRLIEFPAIRPTLPALFSLIFSLCFTSFTIVLLLGGGPKFTTLEVAIFQAISFEFDLSKAAFLALLQFAFCLLFFTLNSIFNKTPQPALSQLLPWRAQQKKGVIFFQFFLLCLASLFMLAPLLNTLLSALFSNKFFSLWQNPSLWRALAYSFTIAPCAAILALIMAIKILLLARRLHWLDQIQTANLLINLGMVILAIPMLVLALGVFLLLQDYELHNSYLFALIVLFNALAALPFVLRVLAHPMLQNLHYYEKLCQSLNIQGWARFRLIEWENLRHPIQYAFALACALSLGDFTAIALFGNQDFISLPYLLYQQLGSYRMQDAAVTASILLLSCLLIFLLIENPHDFQIKEEISHD